jgi:8-oxo-dGTP diphosphatase
MHERACAAILRDGHILMVRHHYDRRDYWTLPGGGVEQGETPELAVLREVREEVGLSGIVSRLLFDHVVHGASDTREFCYLVTVPDGQDQVLGYDPELPSDAQVLTAVSWFPLQLVRDDCQVAKVLAAIRDPLAP